ncbi:GNAT family N-acetyltransferase [Pseudobutyrivibrio sp.]|uniref:GNAT family N-acetyltransferase n=1 Tax=Pseudobutyrivibrio sp. TaxID=2014367 RepID=UPI0038631B79
MRERIIFREIEEADDEKLAMIIRDNLETYHLDIPGTAYFDESLDHLSQYYLGDDDRAYFVALLDGEVVGGVGFQKLDFMKDTAELQKLYLADCVKGQGISYKMMSFIEENAFSMGFTQMYLETHSNLVVAMHLYEKCGYHLIEKPAEVVHSAMDRFYLKNLLPVVGKLI